jgi:cell division protein FtsN
MGIAAPDALPSDRSSIVSATYVAIALVFFFGIGLAGGAAYKLVLAEDGVLQTAVRTARAPDAPAMDPTPSPDIAVAELARIVPTAPPALALPPAPGRIATAAPAPSPAAAPIPAMPTPVAAIPPKKPMTTAKASRIAPPTATGHIAGPYRVQFGAFAGEENARRVQWAVEATGVKIEVTQAPGASGHELFYVRSSLYPDYAAAVSAAQTVQRRVQDFVNAIPIEYAILGDRTAVEQRADAR